MDSQKMTVSHHHRRGGRSTSTTPPPWRSRCPTPTRARRTSRTQPPISMSSSRASTAAATPQTGPMLPLLGPCCRQQTPPPAEELQCLGHQVVPISFEYANNVILTLYYNFRSASIYYPQCFPVYIFKSFSLVDLVFVMGAER